jgi:hypothetical protein
MYLILLNEFLNIMKTSKYDVSYSLYRRRQFA